MRKKILGMAGAVLLLANSAAGAQAKCGQVSISEMNWASSAVVTAVAKFLMEEGYGCTVKKVPSSTVPVVTSLAEKGQPDITTELWLNGAAALPKLIKDGKVLELTRVLSDGGIEGWYVPKYLADKHPELNTIQGILANPSLVGGRFHQCPSGWGCQIANASLIEAFEVEKNGIEVFQHGSGETLATSIGSAFADKKPWFGYYWEPTAILGRYEMVRVDLGPVDEKIHKCNADKDCGPPGKSQFPASPVATVVTTNFEKREPTVTDMLRKLSFTNKQMGAVLAWRDANRPSADEAAVYFLENYKEVWPAWLNDAARKKLAPLMK